MGDTQLENGHRGRQQCGVLMWGNPEQTAIAKNCIRVPLGVSVWLPPCWDRVLGRDDPVAGMTWEASRFHARSRSQNACFRFPCFSREGVLVAGRGLGAEFFEDFGVWEVERFSRLLRPFVYACLEGSDSLGVGFPL